MDFSFPGGKGGIHGIVGLVKTFFEKEELCSFQPEFVCATEQVCTKNPGVLFVRSLMKGRTQYRGR
jgi:hypothetical protein